MDPSTSALPARLEPGRTALRPRNAATLIIIDRSGRAPKLLMGRRHASLAFMPGKFVFPGGRIEPGDRRMAVAGALSARVEDALAKLVPRASHSLGRALALAAIRETYEETGLLVGTREYGPPDFAPDESWAAFREEGVMPDLESLHLIARAITPPGRPRRFDTRFFAVDRKAVAAERADVVTPHSELVELAWVTLPQARALDLPGITGLVLGDLEARIAGGFARHLPIPFYAMRNGKPQLQFL